MPNFCITIVNDTFTACDDHELDSAADAKREGLKGALQIGVDEVRKGKPFFAAEVKVERGNELVERFVISIGASALQ